jgi:ubiquinone biosynthesis monooxygenase Coq7
MEPERLLDPLIVTVDRALRSVFAPASAGRPIPEGAPPRPAPAAQGEPAPAPPATPGTQMVRVAAAEASTAAAAAGTGAASPSRPTARVLPLLSESEKREAAALMRVNHAGEVAAQALYHGQAALARDAQTREMLLRAAREESDHLAWCQDRLRELDSRPSLFSPLWYAGSFAIGAFAAALGDRVSLGFVAETERQVEGHIDSHLERLPPQDSRSRAILEQMRADEIEHGEKAISAGGMQLPGPVRQLMRRTARVMTFTSYWV